MHPLQTGIDIARSFAASSGTAAGAMSRLVRAHRSMSSRAADLPALCLRRCMPRC